MGKVIAKRFIFMIPVVLAVTFIIFMLSFISAGDAARVLAEKKYEHPSPEQVEEVRHEEGLDQPVLVQYGKWLDQALHGDFGKSYSTRKPAFEELKRYFPQTFKLAVTSFLLLMIVSVPLGILSAIYENRVLDKVIRILSSLSVSMPSFWIGLMPVSYTHLDVYKRQSRYISSRVFPPTICCSSYPTCLLYTSRCV